MNRHAVSYKIKPNTYFLYFLLPALDCSFQQILLFFVLLLKKLSCVFNSAT